MADFKKAYTRTAVFEGGYTNDPDDNGNWTGGAKGMGTLVGSNDGIAAPVLAKYLGRVPTVADMKNISKETVENIYRKSYWNPIRGDEIISQDEANQIYDTAVNMGVGTAIKLATRALQLQEKTVMDNTVLNKLNA